ncbi:MAG: hypothetical protein HZC43_08610 [Nitrosomonadales bacterium]|nr:hypothetical protein [Nitrosomonadales bacterium]
MRKEKPAPVLAAPEAAVPAAAAAAAAPLSEAAPKYVVKCHGTDLTLSSCYAQADEVCELQSLFVSSIVKIEESRSGGIMARSIIFRCNTDISYGNVGFPDNARVPALQKKPSLQEQLLYGK